jgi:hypothetical protein
VRGTEVADRFKTYKDIKGPAPEKKKYTKQLYKNYTEVFILEKINNETS